MISKETLKDILLDQKEYILSEIKYVDRDINLDEYINNNLVTIICGVRRCGKSTLLRIFLNKIIKNNQNITYLYCDFSDERLNKFELDDFQKIFEIFLEKYKDGKKYFFFDEIQSINGWEKFANRMYEKENAKLFITGSNKSLLRSDTSTVLTGRQRLLELYPFSFREFLKIKPNNFNILNLTTKERMKLSNYFEEYFQITGFPYPLEINDKRTLQEYFNNILYKDIISKNKIKQVQEIKDIVLFLANNIGQTISYGNLCDFSGIKSKSTIKKYINYLKEAYLVFTISKYDKSIRKQIQNPKKIYFVDVGFARIIGTPSSENKGWYLENIIYLELLRRKKEIYYNKNGNECDFLIKNGIVISEAIQATYEINNKTKDREVQGLISALKKYNLKEGTIITRDQEETSTIDGYKIKIVPIYKWLLF